MLTLLKNCLLANNQRVDLVIADDKIAQILTHTPEFEHPDAKQFAAVFDLKFHLVLPGIIDAFAKVINPSSYSNSNYYSESKACAFGGITTFVDVPVIPWTEDYFANLSQKINQANMEALVNFAFAVNAAEFSNLKELSKVQEYAVGSIVKINARTIHERVSNVGLLNDIIDSSKLVYLHLSGPDIDLFFSFCNNKFTKLVFYDITNEHDLNKLHKYKKDGFNIVCATSIYYLLFNQEMLNTEYKRKTLTTDYKLGTMINNLHLWNGVKDGKIDIITSNHFPVTLLEKFETNQPGLPGFETLFSILFDSFWYKRIPLPILEKVLCTNPAQICNFKNKGKIAEGYDADLVVAHTTKRWWIKNEDIVSNARWTPFHNHRISGRIIMTFINGQLVYNYFNQMMPIRNVKAAKLATFDYASMFATASS